MENSSDTNGNRTRDLPACTAVPQPTAPQRVPLIYVCGRLTALECLQIGGKRKVLDTKTLIE